MTLSDQGFSAPQNPTGLFITSPLQIADSGFHPKYDLREPHGEQAQQDDDVEERAQLRDEALHQDISDAYARGYLNGQQAAMVQYDQDQGERDALAAALRRLKMTDQSKLAKQLWETVLILFEEAVGNAKIDKQLMQGRCDEAVAMIDASLGEATLQVALSDAKILQSYDCEIPIVAKPELLPGSAHLVYASGEIRAGSLAIVKEIESRIDLASDDPC